MTESPRYLTKSRFTQALECATKLYYTGKPGYLNNAAQNSFLAALAEGGHQVGALACQMYPHGVRVDEQDAAAQLERTRNLLNRDNVTIYEAAFEAQGLFVRVDILRKRGHVIELVEVKAKSYHPQQAGDLRNTKGDLLPAYLPYLRDIAFQRHVAGLAYPQLDYRCYLMLADTSKTTTVSGLNQQFPVRRVGQTVLVEPPARADAAALGAPILSAVDVNGHIAQILADELEIGARSASFADAVSELAQAYRQDRRIEPVPGAACASCEYKAKTLPKADEPRSGFHECWQAAFGWREQDFDGDTVLDLWNFRKKDELIRRGVLKLAQIGASDIGFDGGAPGAQGLTPRHRQWYQCSGRWPGGGAYYLDQAGLSAAMAQWRYPLHFIDFETSSVPIPFAKDCRPYETTAFQFSHHVLHADGFLEHRSQFLDATPACNPNVAFVRALLAALSADGGTVFRWADHENSVLNQLRRRLLDDPHAPHDAPALVQFIETLTTRKVGKAEVAGARAMVDLCEIAQRHYFHPATRGSSSLKKVLPALMASSACLRALYSQPIYGTARMPSLNHTTPIAWWQEQDGHVRDPYELLPPVFGDISYAEQCAQEEGLPAALREGGAAMAAYAHLQSPQLPKTKRLAIEAALLRYCELDTLAMVMAVQAWTEGL